MRDSPFLCLLYVVMMALALTAPADARHRGNPAPVVATGIQVANGCAAVPTTWTGVTIYVNAGGNDANPGTIGSPVRHIGRAALLANPLGGDTIALQDSGGIFPGYPSDFSFSGGGGQPGIQIAWPAFTRVTAAAGSSPIMDGWFRLKDVSKLLVSGITFLGHSNGTGDPFFSVESDASPASANVVAYNNYMASDTVPTMLGWTAAQWRANARAVGIQATATNLTTPEVSCFTANGNSVIGVGSALSNKVSINISSATHSALISNLVNYHPDDGITWAGSHLEILFNTVTNSFYVGDGNHNDGIQHQSCNNPNTPFYCVDTDIIINGNIVNELTVPAATVPLYQPCVPDGAQGIDSFDDQVDNAQIINNQVADCATNGPIAFYSLTNSLVANNTAVKYVQSGNSGGGCSILGTAHQPGIPSSSNDILRNNVCGNITIDGSVDVVTNGITIDHNLCLVGCHLQWVVSGVAYDISAVGNYAANSGATNTITGTANTGVFTQYNIATPVYDFNPLVPTSPAIAAGTTTGAPAFPNGTARTAPVNEGALGP